MDFFHGVSLWQVRCMLCFKSVAKHICVTPYSGTIGLLDYAEILLAIQV